MDLDLEMNLAFKLAVQRQLKNEISKPDRCILFRKSKSWAFDFLSRIRKRIDKKTLIYVFQYHYCQKNKANVIK